MRRDALFYGPTAAEYYDKLMAGRGKGTYLETKDSYERNASIIAARLRKLRPSGKRLLEVGCGTGNFCIEFHRLGFEVKGTDYSRDLLRRAREKSPRAIRYAFADMRDFREPKPFDFITCLFDTFTYNQSLEEARTTLGCIRRALLPGGVLVLDFHYGRPVEGIAVPLPAVRLSDGTIVQETVHLQTDGTMTLRRSVQNHYRRGRLVAQREIPRLPRLRLSPQAIRKLLREAGFSMIRIEAGFDGKTKENIVVYAVKEQRPVQRKQSRGSEPHPSGAKRRTG